MCSGTFIVPHSWLRSGSSRRFLHLPTSNSRRNTAGSSSFWYRYSAPYPDLLARRGVPGRCAHIGRPRFQGGGSLRFCYSSDGVCFLNVRRVDRTTLIAAITIYLDSCFRTCTNISVSEFAVRAEISRSHLSRVAPLLLGRSIREVFRRRQLRYAKRLLRHPSNLSVDQIARMSGFGDRSTFYRVFRAECGISPAVYRQKRQIATRPTIH